CSPSVTTNTLPLLPTLFIPCLSESSFLPTLIIAVSPTNKIQILSQPKDTGSVCWNRFETPPPHAPICRLRLKESPLGLTCSPTVGIHRRNFKQSLSR
ncbi:uncharacterized protein BO72DRAFT_419737, partial [Aspergillus fijiensis CBS 313.89]